MSRRVLIVSPHFPPVNAPDHQRVRMALPYLREFGWEAAVLAVRPEDVEATPDPDLSRTVPSDITVNRVPAVSPKITRLFGLGSLAIRSLPFLWSRGNEILKSKFDLIFFSTTLFPVTALGPYWRKRFGIPYVLDFQDPWLSDYHKRNGASEPPGGRRKYALSQRLARRLEPRVVREARHIISVSPAYPKVLQQRYPGLADSRFTVLPFGAPELDFELLERRPMPQTIFNAQDGYTHWVYVGRGGKDMAFALRAFFRALGKVRAKNPFQWNKLRIHFIGTDYAPLGYGRKTIHPVAEECGVGDLVDEFPQRIPYFEGLACLRDATALIIPGSDDPGYTASKIYPNILAHKPLLGIFNQRSTVCDVLRSTRGGTLVMFHPDENPEAVAGRIQSDWFSAWPLPVPKINAKAFEAYSARHMTQTLSRVFDEAAS